MPNIREYENPFTTLQPSEHGVEAFAAAGRRIGPFYHQTGAALGSAISESGGVAYKYLEHQEISHGAPALAGLTLDASNKWDQTLKQNPDPNDVSVASTFRDGIEDDLQKFKDGFHTEGGRQWAESRIDALRQHIFTKTAADMSTRAGQAAITNTATLTNGAAQGSYNDPSSVFFHLDTMESSFKAMVASSPTITADTAAHLHQHLETVLKPQVVQAAVQGAIEKAANPEDGLNLANDPRLAPYVKPAENHQFARYVEQQNRMRAADERNQRVIDRQDRRDKSEEEAGRIDATLIDPDTGERRIPAGFFKGVLENKELTEGMKGTLLARGNQILTAERGNKFADKSRTTAIALLSDIRRPEGDERRITSLDPVYDAYEKNLLTRPDFEFVKKEFTDLRTPEGQTLARTRGDFVRDMTKLIDKSNPLVGVIDHEAGRRLYEFNFYLRQKEDELRRTGRDPYSLYNPKSPDYMGSDQALKAAGALPSMKESMDRGIQNLGLKPAPQPAPKAVPRHPGESEDEYLSRIGITIPTVPQSR